MSTDIKPDNIGGFKPSERVTILNNAGLYDGTYGTVVDLDHDHGWRVWVRPDGSAARLRMDPDDLERLAPVDATPAPLDPAKVKAGDTVTLESGTALVRDVVIRTKSRGNGQHLFYTGESPDPIAAGVFYIVGPSAWTLTDHQPAPEKSPREQVVDILIDYTNTRADDYDTADQIIAALGPDGPRAVWSREGLHAALIHSDSLKVDPGTGMNYIDPDLATRRLAEYLRGESR